MEIDGRLGRFRTWQELRNGARKLEQEDPEPDQELEALNENDSSSSQVKHSKLFHAFHKLLRIFRS